MKIFPGHFGKKTATCELCGRQVADLTKHHLIPRAKHHNKKIRKQFDRQVMTTQIPWLCRPCHKQIHAVFGEKELAESYYQLNAIRQHGDMKSFIEWISKKPESCLPGTFTKRR